MSALKKIISVLTKFGVLRSGSKSYSGKNTGGDFATSDIMDNKHEHGSKKKPKFKETLLKVFKYLLYGLTIIFLIAGMTLAFLSFAAMSLALTPKLSDKLKLTEKGKKIVFGVGFIGFFIASNFYNPGLTSEIQDGGDNPEIVQEFTTDLSNLIVNLEEASILTEGLLQLEFGSLSHEDYNEYIAITLNEWQEVIDGADYLEEYEKIADTIRNEIPEDSTLYAMFIPIANAQNYDIPEFDNTVEGFQTGGSPLDDINFQRSTLSEKESKMEAETWEQINMEKNKNPDKLMLTIVRGHIGVTARDSYKRLKEHEDKMGASYSKDDKYLKIAENTARGIESASRVTVLMYGAAVTGGTLAGASGVAQVIGGLSTFVSGVDVGIQVTETYMIVIRGDDKVPVELQQIKDNSIIKGIIFLNNVKGSFSAKGIKEIPSTMFAINDSAKVFMEEAAKIGGELKVDENKYVWHDEPTFTVVETNKSSLDIVNQYLPSNLSFKSNNGYNFPPQEEIDKAMAEERDRQEAEAAAKKKPVQAPTPTPTPVQTPEPDFNQIIGEDLTEYQDETDWDAVEDQSIWEEDSYWDDINTYEPEVDPCDLDPNCGCFAWNDAGECVL